MHYIPLAVAAFVIAAGASALPTQVASGRSRPVCVALATDLGGVKIKMLPAQAPQTVANFLRYVDGGLYDEASFYRVVTPANDHNTYATNSLIQGGLGKNEPTFPSPPQESSNVTGIRHERGTISMGRGDPGTAGSEFFIVLRREPSLDYGGNRKTDRQGFAAFGHVVSGMRVVEKIYVGKTDGPSPGPYFANQYLSTPVVIRTARRTAC